MAGFLTPPKCTVNAFLQSQKDLAIQNNKQTENQAIFQAQMLEVVQKVSQLQAKEQDLNDLVESLRKRFPLESFDTEDPADVDEWVVQVEKFYEVFKCTGRLQVQLAAHMFCGAAEIWWKSVKNPYETIEDETA